MTTSNNDELLELLDMATRVLERSDQLQQKAKAIRDRSEKLIHQSARAQERLSKKGS